MTPRRAIIVAVKGVVVRDRRVLIIRRSPDDPVGAGIWECPGGKIDFGEELPAAMLREALEETGLTVKIDRLLFASTFQTNPWRQVVILDYLCFAEPGEVRLSHEHDRYLWATRDEMRATIDRPIQEDYDRYGVTALLEGLVD